MNIHWKAFVLSLPRVRDRRLEAIRQMQSSGISFEIVDAVDARALKPELLQAAPGGWKMSHGEVACYLSHIGMLERVLDYDLDFAVILEDDFKLNEAGRLNLGNLFEHLPEDAAHVQLHNIRDHFFKDYKVREQGEHFNRLDCTNVCTFGYLISHPLAEFILENFRQPRMPIDHLYIEISKSCPDAGFYDLNERLIDCQWDLPSEIIRPEESSVA